MDKIDCFLFGFFVGSVFALVGYGVYIGQHYDTKAVQSGCAVRHLDTLSGDVRTVWNGEKE